MRPSSSTRLVAAASALLLLGLAPSLAQSDASSQLSGLKLSGDKPIQIESDKLEVRQAESVAVFTGNVTVTQGPTMLKAGKMTVYYVRTQRRQGCSRQRLGDDRSPTITSRSTTRST